MCMKYEQNLGGLLKVNTNKIRTHLREFYFMKQPWNKFLLFRFQAILKPMYTKIMIKIMCFFRVLFS